MAQVIIKKDKCKGCGLCIVFCPSKILELSPGLNKKGVKYPRVKSGSSCKGCGFCYLVCPDGCIEIIQTPDSGLCTENRSQKLEDRK